MNTELVLTVLIVVNIITLILTFLIYTSLLTMKTHIAQMHSGMGTILSRIINTEQLVAKLGSGFTEFINVTGEVVDKLSSVMTGTTKFGQIYRTADGKYVASSLEELVEKIKNDSSESDYFTQEEIDRLKKLFEQDDDSLSENDDT